MVPNHEIVVGRVSVQLFLFASGAQLSSAPHSTVVAVSTGRTCPLYKLISEYRSEDRDRDMMPNFVAVSLL